MDPNELERGRDSYASRAWSDAYERLARADEAAALEPQDLELFAQSAYMIGRGDDYLRTLERAHHAYVERRKWTRAARCGFWLGLALALGGEAARADGWFSRADRVLKRVESDCVERGYLLIPTILEHTSSGDHAAAYAIAAEAAEIGERFEDRDLVALNVEEQGQALIRMGRRKEGLRLVDEAMVSVIGGELSPIVTGLIYCNSIAFCQGVYEVRRAREWTAALTRWCEEQPEMVAHSGWCLIHRAEIMQLGGAWPDALAEARRAQARLAQGTSPAAGRLREGGALYRQGEVHRLRGELAAAEEAYREASGCGAEPQPGLALLRLAQGDRDAAAAAIHRALAEVTEPFDRARLLPACVEITLAGGELDAARSACTELEQIAARYEGAVLAAMATHARGSVELAAGAAEAAIGPLRQAQGLWQELEAPYEAARVRELVAAACGMLGDADSAELELEAVRRTFTELGAASDLARVASPSTGGASGDSYGLTLRELEVLRLVAAGKSNREVAAALVLSEHTVARHLQNIYAKLDVSSRTAASAFAFSHQLI